MDLPVYCLDFFEHTIFKSMIIQHCLYVKKMCNSQFYQTSNLKIFYYKKCITKQYLLTVHHQKQLK